jgi:hypothetical protein
MKLRLSETENFIDLISAIESGDVICSVKGSTKMNTPVLRASVVLSLYNIVESTITQTLARIHDEINNKKLNYNHLTKEIKDLALIYFYKHSEKRANIHDSLEVLHRTLDLIRGRGYFELPYVEMTESYKLYSGNLDARIIRKVMKKYGVEISESFGLKLKSIKDGRNTLAHGNKSFEEFGRDLVVPALRDYFEDEKRFLEEVVSQAKKYIEEKQYKITKLPTKTIRTKRRK